MGLNELADEAANEAIPLIAEDIRTVRAQLGITPAQAAKRVRLSNARYRALEEARIPRSQHNMRLMLSVAGRLGLKSVRLSYSDEIRKYMKIDLTTSTLTLFVDDLEIDVVQLKELQYFVRPHVVLTLVQRIGLYATFASRKPVDKQIVELWVAAVFALSLNPELDHYVRLVKDDPPDAEVLVIDPKNGAFKTIKVEITQHGKHSKSVFDVIGRKLQKRYQDGIVLVVLVEQSENLSVTDLQEFLQKNNPHNQQIFLIGRGAGADSFNVVPCSEISSPTLDETAWIEMKVDSKFARKGHGSYVGVSFEPRGSGRLRQAFPQYPIFVRKITLSR